MPKLFEPVRVRAKIGQTLYQMFEGENTLNYPKKARYTLATISKLNGTSNTALIFEAGEPVGWTKPADLHLDKTKPFPKLGGMFDGECHVVFCDGHVEIIRKDPDKELMKCIINPANIKPFDSSKLMKPPPGKS